MRKPSHGSGAPLTATIFGGLGNQMFIAAFARLAAEATGRTLILDTSFYRRRAAGRRPELLAFAGWDGFAETSALRGDISRASRALLRRLHVPGILEFREHGLRPFTIGYDPASVESQRYRRVSGYFQSWQYFEGHEAMVRSMFMLDKPETLPSKIRDAVGGDYIGMHVRRGDYLTAAAQASFGLCGHAYYARALESARAILGGQLPLVLFSDSPSSLPDQTSKLADYVVEPDASRPAAHDLVALSAAQGLVLSNSSFSWWAAYLRDAPDRPVIAPRPWFRVGNSADAELLLPNWHSLDAHHGS